LCPLCPLCLISAENQQCDESELAANDSHRAESASFGAERR
jgi:hypothetical protein